MWSVPPPRSSACMRERTPREGGGSEDRGDLVRLLIVTDHRFYEGPDGVYDATCFDRAFFSDYQRIFPEVLVAARIRRGPPPADARRSSGGGVEFMPLPDARGLGWALGGQVLIGDTLRRAIARVDAVCVWIPSGAGVTAFGLARLSRKPVMFELVGDPVQALNADEHGALRAAFGRLQGLLVRRITRTCPVGSYVSKAHLQRLYPPGADTVHASISSIRLREADVRPPRTGTGTGPLGVVLVANFVPVKRHDVLIRGIHHAVERGAEVTLDLVGDGPERAPAEALARELGLERVVRFHGHVADRARINDVLDRADVFAMTSASEGMPRAMIEAMARGLPAIGSNVGGIAELLPREQLFANGDARQLGELLATLCNDRGLLLDFSRRSHATALEFRSEVLSERRQGLLRQLRDRAG